MRVFRSKAKARRAGEAGSGVADSVPAPASGQREKIRNALSGDRVQTKLEVSSPGDACEREADQVAEQVMHSSAPANAASSSPAIVQRMCGDCEEEKLQRKTAEEEEQNKEMVRTKVEGSASNQTPARSADIGVVRSGGQPLSSSARSFFEPRFGRDFGDVRVHADSGAAEASRALRAQAFTYRNHIAFASGRYSPDSPSGRKLLAHELTHVVQQGKGASAIRRAPDDATTPVTPASPVPAARAPGPAAPSAITANPKDPDAQETLIRGAFQALTHVSSPTVEHEKKTVEENETASAWTVLWAFGGEDGLNAAFDSLSPEVKKQVDEDTDQDFLKMHPGTKLKTDAAAKQAEIPMLTQNRIQFFVRMRLYFPSWGALLDHFRDIEEVSDGDVDLFLHKDAAARFRRAIAALKAKGKKPPKVHGGFQLRKLYRGEFQHPGYMVHAMGYAFDASAKGNPKISMGSPQATGVERNVQTLLAVLPNVGPDRARMALDQPAVGSGARARPMNVGEQLDFVVAMGQRTANDLTAAHDDADPKAVAYFQNFDRQFDQMQQGSEAFKHSLPPAHRDALLRLRDAYFNELKSIRDEKQKRRPDPAVLAMHERARVTLLSIIPNLIGQWIAALDAAIDKEVKKHPGMNPLRSPSVIGRDLKTKSAELKTAETNARQAADAVTQAQAARDSAKAAFDHAQQQLDRTRRQTVPQNCAPHAGRDWSVQGPCQPAVDPVQPARQKVDDARAALEKKMDALVDAVNAASKARMAIPSLSKTRDDLNEELKKADKPDLQGSWQWLDQLDTLKTALLRPDLSSASGIRSFERLTTGDLSELGNDSVADNPPLIRLLDMGFFNPTTTFDRDFFEEMVHSGFQPGASWQFGGVDSMHFELTQGRLTIQSPGIFPKH